MDDLGYYCNYDEGCWDNNHTEEFFSNFDQAGILTNCEQTNFLENEFYLPEEYTEEHKETTLQFDVPFITTELAKINKLDNDVNIVSNNSENNNNNKRICIKRKAPNYNTSRFTKQKIQQNDKICSVCFVADTKYKFPCCEEFYCSAACFKKHNKVDCLEKSRTDDYNDFKIEGDKAYSTNEEDAISNNRKTYHNNRNQEYKHFKNETVESYSEDSDIEEYCLTEDQKNKIKNDLTLKLLLKNNYVRSVFREFLSARDKITYLSHYISDPAIVHVMDQIMKSIEEGD